MDEKPRISPPQPWRAFAVTLALLIGLGGLIVWQWQSLEARNRQENQQRFELEAEDVGQRVLARMRAYEMVLRGVSGLMLGNERVSLEQWDLAVDQLRLQDRYPGIMALGWARHLQQAQLDEYLAAIQASGRKDFRPFPPERATNTC